jgi:hypothetical protein
MTTAIDLKRALDVLILYGEGHKLVHTDQDIIYLSSLGEDAVFATDLRDAGAFWDDLDGWCMIVDYNG